MVYGIVFIIAITHVCKIEYRCLTVGVGGTVGGNHVERMAALYAFALGRGSKQVVVHCNDGALVGEDNGVAVLSAVEEREGVVLLPRAVAEVNIGKVGIGSRR